MPKKIKQNIPCAGILNILLCISSESINIDKDSDFIQEYCSAGIPFNQKINVLRIPIFRYE